MTKTAAGDTTMCVQRGQAGAARARAWLLCLCLSALAGPALAQGEVRGLILARRDVLLAQKDWQEPGSQSAQWFRGFLEDAGKGGPGQDDQEWEDALRYLVGIARRQYSLLEATGFVDDPEAVPILIATLREGNGDTRDFALRTLTWQTRQADLERSAAAVRQALGTPDRHDQWRLWARLPLTDAEKREAQARPDLGLEVRARLGNSQAEADLILAFETRTDYEGQERYALLLGYAGTPPCARALVEGLRSPLVAKRQHEDRSIRVPILGALGLIHQDEPLFTRDARLLAESAEDVFDRWRGQTAYVQDVDAWVRARYNRPAWGDIEVWFKRSHHTPLLAPEGARP